MVGRVGILGGTFDPIHYGHLAIAEAACAAMLFEWVLIIPAGHQPLKHGQHAASAQQRLAMAQLAATQYPQFEVSTIEIERSGPSYTVTTLETLHTQQIGDLFLIIGADALHEFDQWQAPQRILELAQIVGVARPGSELNSAQVYAKIPMLHQRLTMIAGPQLAISSSDIRQRVANGQSIHGLTPEPVITYIHQQKLYQP